MISSQTREPGRTLCKGTTCVSPSIKSHCGVKSRVQGEPALSRAPTPLLTPHLGWQAGESRPPLPSHPPRGAQDLPPGRAALRHAEQLRALCAEVWVAPAAPPGLPAAASRTVHTPGPGWLPAPLLSPPGFGGASLKGNTNQKQKEALLSCWQLCLSMSYEVLLYSWGREKMLISSESIMFHLEPGCNRCFGRNIPLPRSPSRNFISLFHYWELRSPRFISSDGVDC